MLIAHKWSIQGLPVDRRGYIFKGEEELAAVFAFEEVEVALPPVLLRERDSGRTLGGSRNMSGAVGPGLYDMHHAASALGVPTDIERVCSHQNATHRRYSRIKFYLRHTTCASRRYILPAFWFGWWWLPWCCLAPRYRWRWWSPCARLCSR